MASELFYKNKKIKSAGFLGAGRSSIAVAEYIKRNHKNISLILRSDNKIHKDALPRANLFDKIYECELSLSNVREDLLFLSPSVRHDRSDVAALSERGIKLTSDAEFFFSQNEKDVYVITGSDGKSTTASLCSAILNRAYGKAKAIGNIGIPLSGELDSTDALAYAVELSSFQLNSLAPVSNAALITNITPNHLDWHRSLEEYILAKKNALINAKRRVYNYDCETSRNFIPSLPPHTVFSSELSYRQLCRAVSAERYYTLEGLTLCSDGSPITTLEPLFRYGAHNVKNALAAAALCDGLYDSDALCEVINSFTPLLHRCERFLSYGGVDYINSSIDSSPKRTATTLDSLALNVIVIIGGRSKGLDYSDLILPLKRWARAVILTGETGRDLFSILNDSHELNVPIVYESDFDKAVTIATRLATPGDTVILSPASTSFDRFRSFEERGNRFKNIIKDIITEKIQRKSK